MDDARPPALKAVKTFQAPDPDDCRDMTDVRQGVDEIDRMLVALIARRQGYMDAAARIKTDRNVVRDEKRIQDVLAKVKAECVRQGLSFEAIAEPVWREMMERCIAYEFEVWDDLRAPGKAAKP
jgi:isochorismate pyruvate lyase